MPAVSAAALLCLIALGIYGAARLAWWLGTRYWSRR